MSTPVISDLHLYASSQKKKLRACSVCGKVDGLDVPRLFACSGCKLIKYCSKQCQLINWPDHKALCRQDIGKGIKRVAQKMTTDPVLRAYLQVCLVLEFGMDKMSEGELRQLVRTPLFANLEIGIEPTSLRAMQLLCSYKESEWADHEEAIASAFVGTRGMLQLHFLQCMEPESEAQMEMWKKGRGAADRANEWHAPVVVVTCADSVREAIGLVFVIMPEAIDTAKENKPFRTYDPVDGEMYEDEVSVPSYFSHLNLHIRADKRNTLKLRMPLRACDLTLIRRARAPHPEDEADDSTVVALRLKLRRELIYEVEPSQTPRKIPFPLATATSLSTSSDEDSDSDGSESESD